MIVPVYVEAGLTILFGALAGGLTNAIAIWMLFHPYESKGVGPFRIQGAIPKNKARMAKSIGRMVGQRLLTPDDVAARIGDPAVREAFDRAVTGYVNRMLESELGSLRATLPPAVVAELEGLAASLGPSVATSLAAFATTSEFEEVVGRYLERARRELGAVPVADAIGSARRAALRARAERWAEEAAQSDEVERAVRDLVARQMTRLVDDPAPLLERLPHGLVAALEGAIADYLPVAIERLGAALADPLVRQRAIRALRDLLDRAAHDLLLHERIVAKLMVTERTLERVIAGLEIEGMERLGALLEDPDVQNQVARAINEAVVRFLRAPLSERLAALGPDRRAGLERAASDYLLAAMRDPTTRARVLDRLEAALEQAEQRTWGELLDRLQAADAARWLGGVLASERAQQWIASGASELGAALLEAPLGKPRERLPADSSERLTRALADALWGWVQEQVPAIVSRLGVPEMVEEKVLGFSLERLEDLVRGVTQRELDLIVRLGYVLGAGVGALAFGVSRIVA